MGKDPAFLFYPGDFLVGVNFMSFEDRGKYISLLCLIHQHGRLTKERVGLSVGLISDDLKSKFAIDEKGLWYNTRLEIEIEKRRKFIDKQRENGLKGGRPVNPTLNPNKTQSKPNPKPIIEDRDRNENRDSKLKIEDKDSNADGSKESSARPSKKMSDVIWPFDSSAFKDAWQLWTEYRKEKNKPAYKPIGLQGVLSELAKLSGGNDIVAQKIIYQSIHKNWEGFFQLKNENQNGHNRHGFTKEGFDAAIAANFGKKN